MLIVLSGLPGSGKSTVAHEISVARHFPVLSVDPIESAIVRSGIARSFETGLAAYVVAETVADGLLAAGLSPVIDAVNSVEEARDMWRRLADRHRTELRIIECVIGDQAEQRARLAARERNLSIPEPAWADVVRRGEEWTPWPEPHLTLDAIADPDESRTRARRWAATCCASPARTSRRHWPGSADGIAGGPSLDGRREVCLDSRPNRRRAVNGTSTRRASRQRPGGWCKPGRRRRRMDPGASGPNGERKRRDAQ